MTRGLPSRLRLRSEIRDIMEKCIIVAVADNMAIGRGNDLPWHISEDLKRFKSLTSEHPVIMGRRTYESLGRPLPKRTNIVVTRGFDAPDGVLLAGSLEEAFSIAEGFVPADGRCFVLGGGQLYAAAMEGADSLFITEVHTTIDDADTFFPDIDLAIWKAGERSSVLHDEKSGLDFEFVTYTRI